MANTIRIKRRAAGGSTGAPSSLLNAELAYNEQDNVLYYGTGLSGVGTTAASILSIAGAGAYTTLTTTQTISGDKTYSGALNAVTQTLSNNSTLVATTAYVKDQAYLIGNQSISVSGDASGSGTTAITLTLASVGTAGTYTKVTTDAKGRVTAGTTLSASDIPTLTASKISDFDTQVRTSRLDQMAAPTAAVSFNSQKITGLADPTAAQDAATKQYVDATRQGLSVKDAVRAATTADIALSGTQTVDGVSLNAGDRVLVKNQTIGANNGLYIVVSANPWTRTTDSDAPTGELSGGTFVFVQEGTVNADSGWVCTNDGTVTVGTTALTFTQFSGAGQITTGAGLTKTGNTIDVIGTTNRITANADSIDIASTYVGQTSITTLGTIAAGTWNGTTIAVANGGTGATTLTGLVKGNGTSAFTAAVDGTDYLSPTATIDGGTF
jgi:hypothetical protein